MSASIIIYCEAFVYYLRGKYKESEKKLNNAIISKDDLIKIEYNFLLMFI